MRYILLLFIILIVAACSTYDSALIYHKDFHPGNHPLLRFSGYYSDSIRLRIANGTMEKQIRPVFFYSDGSAYAADNYITEDKFTTAANLYGPGMTKIVEGSWGNYKIEADTVILEKFQKIESNYVRIIQKGVVSASSIHWFTRKYHREDYKPVDYSVFFTPYKSKPDSTKNFTRTLKIYNK